MNVKAIIMIVGLIAVGGVGLFVVIESNKDYVSTKPPEKSATLLDFNIIKRSEPAFMEAKYELMVKFPDGEMPTDAQLEELALHIREVEKTVAANDRLDVEFVHRGRAKAFALARIVKDGEVMIKHDKLVVASMGGSKLALNPRAADRAKATTVTTDSPPQRHESPKDAEQSRPTQEPSLAHTEAPEQQPSETQPESNASETRPELDASETTAQSDPEPATQTDPTLQPTEARPSEPEPEPERRRPTRLSRFGKAKTSTKRSTVNDSPEGAAEEPGEADADEATAIPPERVAELTEKLSSDDDDARWEAVTSLSRGSASVPVLLEILKGDNQRAIEAAISALGYIGNDARDARPALNEVRRGEYQSTTKRAAKWALDQIRRVPKPAQNPVFPDRNL